MARPQPLKIPAILNSPLNPPKVQTPYAPNKILTPQIFLIITPQRENLPNKNFQKKTPNNDFCTQNKPDAPHIRALLLPIFNQVTLPPHTHTNTIFRTEGKGTGCIFTSIGAYA
jgi:hypothetical protein